VHVLSAHPNQAWCVAFSPDGTRLATACGEEDPTIKLWETSEWIELIALRGHRRGISGLAWSPDGNIIASGSYDKMVVLWRAPRLPPGDGEGEGWVSPR
jgi:WD40 repeat protein